MTTSLLSDQVGKLPYAPFIDADFCSTSTFNNFLHPCTQLFYSGFREFRGENAQRLITRHWLLLPIIAILDSRTHSSWRKARVTFSISPQPQLLAGGGHSLL